MNILSLFDGMACGMLAFQKAGIAVDNYYAYEIDKYAIQTATHNFPQIQECGDVFNADFTKYDDIDYLIGGSPCFTKGHLVLTADGYKDVSEIQVGDMVLTHRGRYRKVIRTNKREADIVDVRIMGYPVFHTTAEHPFYTLERRKATWNEYKNRKSWRVFSNEPKWTKAIELKPKTHFCGQLIGKSAEINATDIDTELAYILGRYVADGHIRKSKRPGRQNSYQYQVILSIGASKIEQFKKHVMHRHYSCYEHTESVYRVCFSSMELLNFIEQQGFGKGANNKAIPEFIYNLPRDIQLAFLSGYMDGDGHMGEYQYCASTVSPMLAFGLQRLVTQLYGVNVGVTVCNNDNTHSIGNREIHSNYPLYTVVWKESIKKQSVAHIQDGIVWTQVKNVCKTSHTDTVYNIEVDEDNSYTVNNVIVHNCTYWSIAQSTDKRETTASGLGWELFSQYVRALHEAKPKFFIYENNKSMSKAIRESITETFGFEPICINSALVSAQNRQRLYWVGKRNADGTYSKVDVQQPEDRGILLRDVLDDVTDREKGRAVIGSTGHTTEREYFKKFQGNMVCEPVIKPVCLNSKSGRNGVLGIQPSLSSRIYSIGGKGTAVTGGFHPQIAIPVEFDRDIPVKAISTADGKTSAVTTVSKDNLIGEPVCMRYERSGKAKQLRKDYESGKIKHGYHEFSELHPRQDGKTNTLSTVQKDNPICEPVRCFTLPREDGVQTQSKQYRVYNIDGKATTLCAEGGGMGAKTGLYAIPIESGKQLTENEMDYMVRGHSDRRWNHCQRPKQDEKAKCLVENISKGVPYNVCAIPVEFEGGIPLKAISAADGKTYTVYEVKDGNITIKGKTYPIKLVDGYYIIRKLTVSECKRLQTVPEWYEFPVSDTQAYKMLGNGWTVDVIAHLIEATKTGKTVEKIEQLSLF